MFEIMDHSWSKRRIPDQAETVESVEVTDFIKENGHICEMSATVDGVELVLRARVYAIETYEFTEDGGYATVHHGWGVQGTDSNGNSVVLRCKED